MTEQQEQPQRIKSLDEVLAEYGSDLSQLRTALIEREDNALHSIRVAGEQYMALPQLTAKVLMDSGLGSPPDVETRAMIDQQFQMVVDHLRSHFGDEFGRPIA